VVLPLPVPAVPTPTAALVPANTKDKMQFRMQSKNAVCFRGIFLKFASKVTKSIEPNT
jgi:hypothetical protein